MKPITPPRHNTHGRCRRRGELRLWLETTLRHEGGLGTEKERDCKKEKKEKTQKKSISRVFYGMGRVIITLFPPARR